MFWISPETNKKYYYKVPALVESSYLDFRLNEEYDNYDWTKEPKSSWHDILRDRAQELRDSHNYLRLWYSGGSDSQTILNAFLKNGIHLDEIGIWRISPVGNFNSQASDEANKVAIPQIQKIQSTIPKTKIQIYDVGYDQYVNYFKFYYDLNRMNIHDFRIAYSSTMHNIFPGINDHKNIGNITGVEKPKIGKDNNGYFWYFVDETLAPHIVDPNENDHQIMFFMGMDIHCKQCHLVKNYHQENGFTVDGDFNPLSFKTCRDDLFVDFSIGKASFGVMMAPKTKLTTSEALANPKTKNLVYQWHNKIQSIPLDLHFFNNDDITYGLKGLLTKKFYLE